MKMVNFLNVLYKYIFIEIYRMKDLYVFFFIVFIVCILNILNKIKKDKCFNDGLNMNILWY